jgi:hypothetical protein
MSLEQLEAQRDSLPVGSIERSQVEDLIALHHSETKPF